MRTKKQIAMLLVIALIVTTVPNIFDATIATAKEAWKILSEKDLVIDEVYNISDEITMGRKDGKISFLDKNLQLSKQTEYDQIESALGTDWLVSRLVDGKSEFAILDKTGEVKRVLGMCDILDIFYDVGVYEDEYILLVMKENGQYGFLLDEKEIGFDDVFVGEGGLIYAESLTVGEQKYYVKEYFESEDVWKNFEGLVSIYYSENSERKFREILERQNCEFIFYDEEGAMIPDSTIAESIKIQEEQEKIQEEEAGGKKQEIKEAAKQLPIAEYGTTTWKSYKDFNINKISVSRFGKGYLAYLRVKIYMENDSWTTYFAGVYDDAGELKKFGELLAADGDYEYDLPGEEGEYLVLREMNKKIYLYHLGTEKYIYTDTKNDYFSLMYDENSVYGGKVILWEEDYENVLVANPQSDFLKIAKKYFSMWVGDDARNILLTKTADIKELVFYDSDWNEMKKVDLSYLEGDFRYEKYEDGIAVYDEKMYRYIDVYGNDYQVSLSDYPEFEDVEDIYTVRGQVYTYIESQKGYMLYQLGTMDKIEIADNVEIRSLAVIESCGFFKYKIVAENGKSYYGLMDLQGNFVIDAIKMGYTECSVWIRSGNRENMCAEFTDEKGNKFYYYERTLMPHSDDDDWDNVDSIRYDDIVYSSNYLYDAKADEWLGKEERVYDNDGNLLIGHVVPEKLWADSGWKNFIYIYETARTILALNRYWDGKRGGNGLTYEPLVTLTPSPVPTYDPVHSKPEKTAAPSVTVPAETLVPIENNPEETLPSIATEPEETAAPSSIGKGKIKKIKNQKGKKVKLSLKKVENAKGYQIAYATNKKFSKKKLLTSKKLTITVRKLKKKKTYYFKVRAYYNVNGERKYGKWSNVKKIKIRR